MVSNNNKKILLIVGTRPNLVKVTQFRKEAEKYDDIEFKILHTGQHYSDSMSDSFLSQFGIELDYHLTIKSTSPAGMIGEMMQKLEAVVEQFKPKLMLVVGDVNSTLAAAICANKMNVCLGHVESGLRSHDLEMPEEINRIITDQLSDICFVTEPSGVENLKLQGKQDDQIVCIGNTMIDTLVAFEDQINQSNVLKSLVLQPKTYVLVTMHRPRNVDSLVALEKLVELLKSVSKRHQIIFPIHPRTEKSLKQYKLFDKLESLDGVHLTAPLDYFSFQHLVKNAFCILTDSGGIQEESTYRNVPCITLRENTERPITVEEGTNVLRRFDVTEILDTFDQIKNGTFKSGSMPKFWDGEASLRIFKHIVTHPLWNASTPLG